MKNIFSDNQHSEKHLSKINSKTTKDISPNKHLNQKKIY
ncbi:Immunogenic protein p35 (plasmid) [Borrelia miyamotoi FR64b]|uniref:Immunogenic protein p35 n=2 Tax=Borrelia miyamotoi TaxID=47466 RepID=W5SGQ4_9SPIR|nr:Immunogenic protein p35 [Borrelia miyamotoi FR64b]